MRANLEEVAQLHLWKHRLAVSADAETFVANHKVEAAFTLADTASQCPYECKADA